MKKITNTLLAVSTALFLSACGGGSSSSSSDVKVQSGNQTNTSGTNTDYSKVAGVYNVGSGNDEIYLSISNQGLITTYDYLGDSFDNGANCYSKNPSNVNALINGKTLTHDTANKLYTVESVNWVYNDANNIQTVSVSGISAGSTLSMNGLKVSTASKLVNSPSAAEMEQSVCSGS